ncbi:hypothetical protein [Allorhizobium terrae]|uniref:Uncharacterized protein n=1 Tax=Allorhizobium terrae TaxID=1848972 RepID=A0A4V3W955_9HYPH|nr:hypothetical protein [Allorhizobium terrae]THF53857.1 hypothetical protein E6C51_01735 [Allorhizobium terrae]TWD54566.1 hypothetical protein FB480_103479 [Agrobacterium vitis]
MTYDFQDMTMSEMLRDPLIRLMLRADGISLSDFASMLDDAARQSGKSRRDAKLAIPAPHIICQNASQMCSSRTV